MTTTLRRYSRVTPWGRICSWVTSTENRLYVGWFGCLMFPTLLTAISCYVIAFLAAPPVDIDGIREPVVGSLLYGNNIISNVKSGLATEGTPYRFLYIFKVHKNHYTKKW